MKINQNKDTVNIIKEALILIVLFFLSNFLILINGGIFYDDWTVIGVSKEGITSQFTNNGFLMYSYIHCFLVDFFSPSVLPYLHHSIAFVFGLVGVFVFRWILRWFSLPSNWIFGITALYACTPLFAAKVYVIDLHYNVGLLVMLLTAMMFLRYISRPTITRRLLALFSIVVCWFSLIANIPMILMLLFVVALRLESPMSWSKDYAKKVFCKLISWWDFFVITGVFWVFRSIYMLPGEVYSSYDISLKSILMLPYSFAQNFVINVLGFFSQGFDAIEGSGMTIFLILSIFIAILIWRKLRDPDDSSKLQQNHLFWCAVLFFIASSISFLIIGLEVRFPYYQAFLSRYQVLLSLVVPLFLYLFITLFDNKNTRKWLLVGFVAMSICTSIKFQTQYCTGWFKQLALEQIIANDSLLQQDYCNVFVEDNTQDYNQVPEVKLGVYEYTGISRRALKGNQTHCYINSTDDAQKSVASVFDYYTGTDMCNMKDVKSVDEFDYILQINKGSFNLFTIGTYKMLYYYYFNRLEFERNLHNVLSYKLESIN